MKIPLRSKLMKRVVVTGLGIISSIGNDINKVTDSLKSLTSGIDVNEKNKEMGLRSHVSGIIKGTVSFKRKKDELSIIFIFDLLYFKNLGIQVFDMSVDDAKKIIVFVVFLVVKISDFSNVSSV